MGYQNESSNYMYVEAVHVTQDMHLNQSELQRLFCITLMFFDGLASFNKKTKQKLWMRIKVWPLVFTAG